MKKYEEFKTITGQTAWEYYQKWYRYIKKPPPTSATFISSNYFRTFNNFVKFVKKVKLPFPEKFIWFMVEQKFPPTMWTSDAVYVLYINFIDTQMDPLDLARQTICNLIKLANTHDVDPSEVFTVIDPYNLIHKIRVRTLTPWVLLKSQKFKTFFVEKMNTEQQSILETLINPSYWNDQFTKHPDVVNQVKNWVTEMKL